MKNIEKILNLIENMSFLEINNLINSIEKKYNINKDFFFETQQKEFSDKNIDGSKNSTYSLILTDIGKNKISVIKIIKEINNLGLKEAKDLIESFPVVIKSKIEKDLAESVKEKIEKTGAKIDIKKDE